MEILSVSVSNGIYPASESDRDTNPGASLKNYKVVCEGDIVYNSMRMWQGAVDSSLYRGIVSPAYVVARPSSEVSSRFFARLLKQPQMLCQYQKLSQGNSKDTQTIRFDRFAEIQVSMPSCLEQNTIGVLFDSIDNLITLHQCERGENRETITGSWEQRKLSSLCEKFTDGDWIESKDQSDSGVRLVQTGNVGVAEYLDKPNNKKWISAETFDRLHCEEVFPGDILISRLPEPAGRACIMPLLGTKMITAVDCTIVRTAPDVSNMFLVQYLSSQSYFDEVNTCLAGGTRQRISRSNLAEFDVPIPSEKTEQDVIGAFFGYLDNHITLHQRK